MTAIQTMVLTALVSLPIGMLIGMRRQPPLYADPEGFSFEGEAVARSTRAESGEVDITLLAGNGLQKPRAYVSITVAHDDPAGKRFAEHVEKKRKFIVRVEAAR